jgi:hypothetical protein
MCALDLSRVRRFFARFKKPVVFSKIKIVGTQAAIGPQATSLQPGATARTSSVEEPGRYRSRF